MINLNELTVERFAKVFDMAILAPNTQEAAIREGCRQAREESACRYIPSVSPCWCIPSVL